MSQEVGSSLATWFWFRVFHEDASKYGLNFHLKARLNLENLLPIGDIHLVGNLELVDGRKTNLLSS